MAESSGEVGAPNLNLTAEEKRVYGYLFRQADSDSVGVVTGDVAVKFFDKTKLESTILGEIWQIADRENRGFLTPAGFGVVLRLIGHSQAGRIPTPELALQPGPLPRFEGISIPGLATQTTGAGPSMATAPLQTQGTGSSGGPIRIPQLTPEKAAQFASLFERQSLVAGMLPGDQAKQIFEKSGLANEILGQIWQLADTEQRGALVLTEFVIAMHLLTSMKSGQLRALPNILPAALYEAASRRPSGIPRQQTPTSTPSQIPAIPRQLSGQAQMRTGSPLGRSHPPPPSVPQAHPHGDWLVAPSDKTYFDKLYDELDKTKRGFITGEEAVTFFSQSNLPEDILAQIWDLADINSAGRLTKDEFAIAMYLIRQQRNKRDTPSPLPAALPPNLIPPSMRRQARPPQPPPVAAAGASPFDLLDMPSQAQSATPPQPKNTFDDLFSDATAGPEAPRQTAMTTGGSNDPFGSNASPAPASPAKPSPPGPSTFAPFVPSSSFGRTLTVQTTGSATPNKGVPEKSPSLLDLLGDDSPEQTATKPVIAEATGASDAAELTNLSNQVSSLSKQMQDVQNQRTATQNELQQASIQKKNFEQRLSQLRALYEKEAGDVRSLQDQLNTTRNDTKKMQSELVMLEGAYQDLQAQHRQLSGALQADQQESESLKERVRVINTEVEQLKQQVEKLKLEGRQQKGLVAINKKQLSSLEGERDKVKSEADDLTKSNEEMARQINTSSPVSASAQISSPALSTSSGNNPFFRRTGSTDLMGAFASPPTAKPFNSNKSFEDIFGPSLPATNTSTPPPQTSFLPPQNTGASTASAGSFATPATSNTPNVSRQPTLALGAEATVSLEPRQGTSSFHPFAQFGQSKTSLSSSRQVSPPVSRMGQPDRSDGEGPINPPPASPLEPTTTGQSAASGSISGSQRTEAQAQPPSNTADGGSLFGPHSSQDKDGNKTHGHSDSVGDPFSAMDHTKAKEDFDSAFASFKSVHSKPVEMTSGKEGNSASTVASTVTNSNNKGFANFNKEFPPISELQGDDSDSDSDDGGFDDDFAPASPKGLAAAAAAGNNVPDFEAARPTPSQTCGTPGFPASVDGVMRDLTASPAAAATATASSSSVDTAMPPPTSSTVDAIFGSSSGSVAAMAGTNSSNGEPVSAQQQSTAPSAKKPSAFDTDDDDDDFSGLEDAREGSAADDDFANISRSGLDDFNPVFDSSPPRSHEAKSDSSTQAVAGQTTGSAAPHFGTEKSSFNFVSGSSASLGSGSGVGATGAGASANAATTNSNHHSAAVNGSAPGPAGTSAQAFKGGASAGSDNPEWDALFVGLEEASTPAATGPSSSTTPATATVGSGSVSAASAPAASRPSTVGRVLTETGEHDDPILKNLTSMGYSRSEAVNALEKYDYNLDRAANYLASHS